MTEAHQLTLTEQRRFDTQSVLDGVKTQAERNRMGQFATPFPLALEILSYANKLVPSDQKVHFFDPALGTGAFYSALLQTFPANQIEGAAGFEIDPHYGNPAAELWGNTGLEIRLSDFTKGQPSGKGYNLLICNPPYVRHHHIVNGEKARIQAATRAACGVNFSGLSGLYCYFMGLSHAWMAEGGIAGWLIPSEFMDVNYGKEVKNYLLNKVRLFHVHRFDPFDVQFGDALVSSAVVWFRKEKPPKDYEVDFSFGGTLSVPKVIRMVSARDLRTEKKWTRFPVSEVRGKEDIAKLSDFFSIQRGLATGDNNFFILTPHQIAEHGLPPDFFKPILPSPRYLQASEVVADEFGNPALENPLFLLDCRLPEAGVKRSFPSLWRYFQEGKEGGVANRYLCQHRSPWYAQENRPATPFVCTYLGRGNVKSGRPFRFILNQSRATVTNVYLALYPKPNLARVLDQHPTLIRQVWEILNDISPKAMLAEGRVYGGGLHKLEPKELANVPAQALADLISELPASSRNYTPYLQKQITRTA
jgi:hypothetical protein